MARPAFRSARPTMWRHSRRHAAHKVPEASMFNLTGKTALVTGATGGIGGAIARALHAQGAKVAVSGTRREVLDTLAAELGGAPVLPCDLSNKDSVEALFPDAEKALGQVD